MSGFYKMDPAAWDFGTANLSLEEEAAYLRIVNAIHKHDAGVPDNDRVLAGLFRVSTRKARALLNALVEAGKVSIQDGQIWNERARSDMVRRQFTTSSAQVRGSKGGRTRAENAAKSLETKDTDQAIASTRIEENRIEYSDANASGGDAAFPDPVKDLFDRIVAFLLKHGVTDRNARSFLAKLRKSRSDQEIRDAFNACREAGAVDPISWVQAALGQKKTPAITFDLSKFEDVR